ncbi:MAG: serine/threonine-protein kinase, partial [Myxococcota bacterium]
MLDVASFAAGTRAAHSAASSTLDDDARELLQVRLRKFATKLALICGSFLLFRVSGIAFGSNERFVDQAFSLLTHGLALGMFATMWGLARGRPRSGLFLRRLEGGGFILGCTFLILMALEIPTWLRPEFILVLAISLANFGRAASIPSSGRRTATLGAIVTVPLLSVVAYSYARGYVSAEYAALDADFASIPEINVIVYRTLNTAMWWLASVVVAASTSQSLYGLRRDIQRVRRLGRYELLERIGQGGMGEVYRAQHALLERPTAVKILPPDSVGARSEGFEREVQRTAKLTHPNTVTIFDYGRTADGVFYYAMELIDGLTLDELVEVAGPLPPHRAVHLLRQMVGPLVEAHGVGLIHRDIKPGNIMVDLPHRHGGVPEVAKVLDFGLAKDLDSGQTDQSRTDYIKGTPLYMAPEAIRSPETIDGRTDIYALGAVAYFLLVGEPVFRGR